MIILDVNILILEEDLKSVPKTSPNLPSISNKLPKENQTNHKNSDAEKVDNNKASQPASKTVATDLITGKIHRIYSASEH